MRERDRSGEDHRRTCQRIIIVTVLQGIMFVLPFAILVALMAWHLRSSPAGATTSRDAFTTVTRVWKRACFVTWAIGMLSLIAHAYLWYEYRQDKPRTQEPAIGRVYPEHMRGVTVYLTRSEKRRLDLFGNVSSACVIAGFVVFGIVQRQQQRSDEQRYVRP